MGEHAADTGPDSAHSGPLDAREADERLNAWRARVLRILLAFLSISTLVPLVSVLFGQGLVLPPSLLGVCCLLYLVLLLATLRPRWSVRARAGILLSLMVVMGTIQLMVGQLAGHGRILLLVVPLLALLLMGPRAGWAAVALSAVLFAAVPRALHSGWLHGWGAGVLPGTHPPAYWMLQWILWLSALLVLMILFTRYQRLQQDTMVAERLARRQLEAETTDRFRLEEALGRLGEDERRRLGAELHDGLCQHLTAALLNCSALENRSLSGTAPEPAAVTQLRVSLEEAIGMAYDVAKGLCPVDMGLDSLIPALERLCREVRDRRGIACRLQADPRLTIHNPEHAVHLYRMALEAVTNAVKHAQGTLITVRLEQAEGELVLQVTDDGPLAAPGVSPVAGLGLSIMAYRARLIGGVLKVAGGENGGMQVTCRVPGSEGAS